METILRLKNAKEGEKIDTTEKRKKKIPLTGKIGEFAVKTFLKKDKNHKPILSKEKRELLKKLIEN